MAAISSQPPTQPIKSVPVATKSTGINKLPVDILQSIHSFSGPKDLSTYSSVNISWNAISCKPKLWEEYAKRLNIPIKKPENAKLEVLAYRATLSEINELLKGCLSTENTLSQSEYENEEVASKVEDDPFELHIKIRRFIRNNLKTDKLNSILIPFVQELYEKIKDIESHLPIYPISILALQLLIDEGVPIKIKIEVDSFESPASMYYDLNYNSEFEPVFTSYIEAVKKYDPRGNIDSLLNTSILRFSLPILKFLVSKYDIKGDRLFKLFLPIIPEWDYYEASVSKTTAIMEFLVSRFKSDNLNPIQLVDALDSFEKSQTEKLSKETSKIVHNPEIILNLHNKIAKMKHLIKS